MSLVEHIAAQRTEHGVPHALSCRALGVAPSTFYERRGRAPSDARVRREGLDAAVKERFEASGGAYGSPRVRAQLRRDGVAVSEKTVEASIARQGLQGRSRRRRRGLTRPDKSAAPAPDLLGRDFTVQAPDQKWVGDFKQADTDQGPVFLATVEDLYSRRMLGFATSDTHPTAELAEAALNMAAATRGGDVAGVIFHTDRGSQYTSETSPRRAGASGSPSPWDAQAAHWTMPQRSRSSPPSSTNSSHGAAGAHETRPGETSPPGSTPGTTPYAYTPPTT